MIRLLAPGFLDKMVDLPLMRTQFFQGPGGVVALLPEKQRQDGLALAGRWQSAHVGGVQTRVNARRQWKPVVEPGHELSQLSLPLRKLEGWKELRWAR